MYLANSSGIIDANMVELIGVAFMSSALSVIQNGLEQAKPKYTFEEGLSETVDWYLENSEWLKNVTSGAYQEYYRKMYA